jgi:Zn-finger nucleic acid-binding protein
MTDDRRLSSEAIMESEDPEVVQLELKYCERCGALWLRRRGGLEVYCPPCDLEMLDLPAPRRLPSKPRVPGNHKIERKSQSGSFAICGQGGQA